MGDPYKKHNVKSVFELRGEGAKIPSWIWGVLLLREGKGRERREDREKEGRGIRGRKRKRRYERGKGKRRGRETRPPSWNFWLRHWLRLSAVVMKEYRIVLMTWPHACRRSAVFVSTQFSELGHFVPVWRQRPCSIRSRWQMYATTVKSIQVLLFHNRVHYFKYTTTQCHDLLLHYLNPKMTDCEKWYRQIR